MKMLSMNKREKKSQHLIAQLTNQNIKSKTEEEQSIALFLAFCAAALVTFTIGSLLNLIPNVLNVQHIISTYNIPIDNFVPETSEKLQYIICTLSFPLLYMLFHFCFRRISVKGDSVAISRCLTLLEIVFAVASVFYLNNKIQFYFTTISLSKNPVKIFIYTVFAVFVLIIFMHIYESLFSPKIFSIVLFVIALVAIFFVAKLYITKTYYINNTFMSHHFDAYFYPVYKVYSGQTPLVDFDSLYGFYPYFIAPIFKLLGGISMYRFSFVMAGLVFISLSAIALALFMLCKNKALAFFGVLAICFTISILPMLYQGAPYYLQYFPHRVLFPSLLLLLCAILLKLQESPKRKYIERMGFFFTSLAMLWNIDTGVIVFISYCAFLIYMNAYSFTFRDKKLIKYIIYVIAWAMVAFIFAFMLLLLVTYFRTGKFLNPKDIIYGQTSFYGDGFFMIRMTLIHPWLILIGIYAVSLVKAIRDLAFMRTGDPRYSLTKSSFYFLLPVLGMGIFSYYQGRSDNFVLPAVLWPGVVLLILFAQEYADGVWKEAGVKIQIRQQAIPIVKFILTSMLISFIVMSFVVNMFDDTLLKDAKAMGTKETQDVRVDEVAQLMGSYGNDGQPIDLVMYNSAAIYSMRKDTRIPKMPATIDLYTKADYAKCMQYLKNTNNTVIFDTFTYNLYKKYCDKEFTAVFLDRYNLKQNLDSYIVFVKK